MIVDTTLANTNAVVLTDKCSGGPTYFQYDGTFGGTTLTVRASYDGGTTKTTLFTATAAGFQNVDLPQGTLLELQCVGGAGMNLKVMTR